MLIWLFLPLSPQVCWCTPDHRVVLSSDRVSELSEYPVSLCIMLLHPACPLFYDEMLLTYKLLSVSWVRRAVFDLSSVCVCVRVWVEGCRCVQFSVYVGACVLGFGLYSLLCMCEVLYPSIRAFTCDNIICVCVGLRCWFSLVCVRSYAVL